MDIICLEPSSSNANKHADIGWRTLSGPELKHVHYRQFTDIDVVQLRSDLNWAHEFDEAGKLTSKLSLGGNRENARFREQGYAADSAQNLDDATDGVLRVYNLASYGKYAWPGWGAHVLEAGWEGSLDRRRESRMQHLLAFAGSPESTSDLSFDAQIRRAAIYAQDEWTAARARARWHGCESVRIGYRRCVSRSQRHRS